MMAAKNMQPRMVTIPNPPRTRPTRISQNSTMRPAISPFSMIDPARMKAGTARSGNMSETLNRSSGMIRNGRSLKNRTATVDAPRAM